MPLLLFAQAKLLTRNFAVSPDDGIMSYFYVRSFHPKLAAW